MKRSEDALTYRYDLDDAVSALSGTFGAERRGPIRVLSPTFWLVRPDDASGLTYSIEVQAPEGFGFAHGFAPRADASVLASPAMSVFGPIAVRSIRGLRVVISPGHYTLPDQHVIDWAERSAAGVFDYFGEPPSAQGLVLILPCDRRAGPHRGFALGYRGGASVRIHLGPAHTELLDRDWSLTHEMVHLGFPNIPRHPWLEEGIATYLEPLIRARGGQISKEKYWRDLFDGTQNAVDRQGRMGFTAPLSWGDVYWGGALFFLRADLSIRTRTKGAKSLDDALIAIHMRAGNIRATHDAEAILRIGDAATGGNELTKLYRRLSTSREAFDLGALFARLGVERIREGVRFDERAPGARLRRSFLRSAVSTRLAP